MNRSLIHQRLDEALNELIADRDLVLRSGRGADQRARLAELFTREADLWGQLHEATTSLTQARAAIRARQYAQSQAARLRSRVSTSPTPAA